MYEVATNGSCLVRVLLQNLYFVNLKFTFNHSKNFKWIFRVFLSVKGRML